MSESRGPILPKPYAMGKEPGKGACCQPRPEQISARICQEREPIHPTTAKAQLKQGTPAAVMDASAAYVVRSLPGFRIAELILNRGRWIFAIL